MEAKGARAGFVIEDRHRIGEINRLAAKSGAPAHGQRHMHTARLPGLPAGHSVRNHETLVALGGEILPNGNREGDIGDPVRKGQVRGSDGVVAARSGLAKAGFRQSRHPVRDHARAAANAAHVDGRGARTFAHGHGGHGEAKDAVIVADGQQRGALRP